MVHFFKVLVRLCIAIGVLALAGSYAGAVHPLGDSLAVFRIWIAGGLACVALLGLLLRVRRGGGIGLALALAAVAHVASFNDFVTRAIPLGPDLVVYTKNLGAGRADWAALANDIEVSGADVVVLQEVTQQRMAELPGLLPDHPFQHICNFSGWSAMAVASRYPLSQPGCTDHRSLAHAIVDAPSGPIWVASIHQVWPFPHQQAALLPDILAAVRAAPPRQVVAGDFNMVPWGHSVRAISQAGGLHRISPFLPTIEVRGIGLSIDHVLTDGEGMATRRARLGSDHYGMVTRIRWD